MKLAPALQSLLYTVALLTGALGSPVWASEAPVPYDLEKFRPVLDDSKLQAPTSSPAKIEQGNFEGQSNQYLFLDETGQNLIFTVAAELAQLGPLAVTGDGEDEVLAGFVEEEVLVRLTLKISLFDLGGRTGGLSLIHI